MWDPIEYDYFPTGQLALVIDNAGGGDFSRCQWRDAAKQRVESCINGFLAGLLKASEGIKASRVKHAAWQQKHDEERRLREEQEQRRRDEEARVADLDQKVAAWAKYQQMREFIAAVRTTTLERNGAVDPESDLAQWLSWADAFADRHDSIKNGQTFTMKANLRATFASPVWPASPRGW